MTEAIILFCTIFGTWIAYQSFKSPSSEIKEICQRCIEKFEYLASLNNQIVNKLSDYGEKTNSFDLVFMQGLTLKQCIQILKDVKIRILNDETLEAIKQSKSKLCLQEILNHLDTQIKHHSETQTTFNYFIKST